ncbi:MFS transporter, SP family, sugar:H+ symporter, partial [Phenoliferia sp. Uapishka_3]
MTSRAQVMAIATTCFAGFGGFLYGYDTGYISGVKEMPYFKLKFGDTIDAAGAIALSSGRNSVITSIMSVGTFCGALGAYSVGDFFGRRYGIIFFLGLFSIGIACQTAATSYASVVVGRVFAGFGVGGTSCLVPMYQAECAPKGIRGAIVGGYQWVRNLALGFEVFLYLASVLTVPSPPGNHYRTPDLVVNATQDFNNASAYRIPIGVQFIWAAILGVGLLFLPESPRWLIMKDRELEARKCISRIISHPLDSPEVDEEYAEIHANLLHERSVGQTSYLDCFRNGEGRNALRVWSGIGIQALQQLTGINFIFYYGIATAVVNVGCTPFGLYLIERVGRRPLLMYGAFGMAVSQFIVAIVGTVCDDTNMPAQRTLVGFVCIFVGHFAITWGIGAWVVTSEIYPLAIRGKAMSMSTASNWLLNFAIGYATPYLGLSLEQVDILYRNSSMIGSNAYRMKILAEDIHDEGVESEKHHKAVGLEVDHVDDVKTTVA